MHLSGNTCKWIAIGFLLALWFTVPPVTAAGDQSLELKWKFPAEMKLSYSILQEARIQYYFEREDAERPLRSPVHNEITRGTASFETLPDGNAYGDLLLKLVDIRENNVSLDVPEKQKIPQKVCRFIMTPEGSMEQYSGPKKETYVLTRLIFGVPIQRLKMSEVRMYPFTMYTDKDESRSPMTGRISHEFQSVEVVHGAKCAKIVTTVDLTDGSPGSNIQSSVWKGTATSLFNIDEGRLESSEWSLAVKQTMTAVKEEDPVMSVQIYTIKVERSRE